LILERTNKLSVVILLNERKIPLWIFSSIERLLNSSHADVTLVVSKEPSEPSLIRKPAGAGMFLLKLVEKIDYLIFKRRDNYNLLKDIAELQTLGNFLELNTVSDFPNKIQNQLKQVFLEIQPDLAVTFGLHCLNEELLLIPRYGIFSFSIDTGNIPGGFDYGFWEVFRYRLTSWSTVGIITNKGKQNEVIFGSMESTCPFSINKNRNNIFYRTSLFLTRLTEGLRFNGDEYILLQKERHNEWRNIETDVEISVDFFKVLRDTAKYIARVSRLVINKILYTDAFSWEILINKSSDMNFPSYNFSEFKPIKSQRDLFWADPFVISQNDRYYIFLEEFIYKTNKAHISLIELDSNGETLWQKKVIDKAYHLSYPFVFKEDGIYYMIPETASNKTIELYRCVSFPDVWEFDRYIMRDVLATDTTLFHFDGKWWLFTTLDQTGGISGGSTELFLFFADSPFADKWISHPLNPIVSDESRARCAGNLFVRDGEIYRPSQDCTMRYGRGLNFNRIIKMNENEFIEVVIDKIKPEWDSKLKGLHTFNYDDNLKIIDVYRFHRRFS
jgi:hypothetical protein